MNKDQKAAVVAELKDKFSETPFIYFADSSKMSVAQSNEFRKKLFEKNIQMKVVKNTLAIKAIEQLDNKSDYEGVISLLKGTTALLFTDTANAPARIIKDFRKTNERPLLKGAYIDSDVFVGDEKIDELASLKSKEELIADVISLLQAPMMSLIGALNSGGNTISGVLKTLESRDAS